MENFVNEISSRHESRKSRKSSFESAKKRRSIGHAASSVASKGSNNQFKNLHESSEKEFNKSVGNKSFENSNAFNAEGGSVSHVTVENVFMQTPISLGSHITKQFLITGGSLTSSYIRTMNSMDKPRSVVSPIDESVPNAELSEPNRDSQMNGQQTPSLPAKMLDVVNRQQEKVRAQTNNSPFKPYNMTLGQRSIFDTPK